MASAGIPPVGFSKVQGFWLLRVRVQGFRFPSLGFGVLGVRVLGFRVEGLRYRAQDIGLRVHRLGFGVEGLGSRA